VKRQLLQHGIVTEEFGGDVQCVEISVSQQINLDTLVDAINAQAELLDLRIDPTGPAESVIVESRIDRVLFHLNHPEFAQWLIQSFFSDPRHLGHYPRPSRYAKAEQLLRIGHHVGSGEGPHRLDWSESPRSGALLSGRGFGVQIQGTEAPKHSSQRR